MKIVNEDGCYLASAETEDSYPRNYGELCVFLEPLRKPISSGDGKIYSSTIGKAVWANIVTRKRPANHKDTPVSTSIYQLIGELGFHGDFPAMLYLYDRLNVTQNEYNAVCRDRDDDRHAIFRWAREVFTHASKINAVHGNGNVAVFQYVNMPDELDEGGEQNDYLTAPANIGNIVALFDQLSRNQGRVGHADEDDV